MDWTISEYATDSFLPVELSSFTCVATARYFVRLDWVTQSESNVSGNYITFWDGKNDNGKSIGSGVYFLKMNAGKFVTSGRMVLLK